MVGVTVWDTLIGWFYSSDVTWSPAQWLYETTDQDLQLTANDSGNLAGHDVWVSPGAAWWRDYLLMTGFRVWDFCVELPSGRLVRNKDANLLGVTSDEIEADQGADAATKHKCRLIGQRRQQAVCIIAVRLKGQTPDWAINLAPRQAPTIVSHDHIVIDELVAKRFHGVSIGVSTRQDQERRTRSGHPVEEGGASHVKRIFVRRTHCSVSSSHSLFGHRLLGGCQLSALPEKAENRLRLTIYEGPIGPTVTRCCSARPS
jgi:hypothetical protein